MYAWDWHPCMDHNTNLMRLWFRCVCYMEKAPNAWHRQGTQKTRNTYNQPNRPNQQTSQTMHQVLSKGQPGRRITPINTAAVHASAQPTIITRTQRGHHQILSANAARCEAKEQYTGGLSRTTPQTPPTSAGTRSAPPPTWGAHHQEWPMASPGRTAYF